MELSKFNNYLFNEVVYKYQIEPYTKGKSNKSTLEKLQLEKTLKVKAEQVSLYDFIDIAFPNAQGYFCIFQNGDTARRNDFMTREQLAEKLPILFENTWGMNAYVSYSTYFKNFRGYEMKDVPVTYMEDGKKKSVRACDIATRTEYVVKVRKRVKVPVRVQENIHYTYMLTQDLDFYKLGMTQSQAINKIAELIENGSIICPTFFVFTGQGIQLIWTLKPFKNIENFPRDREWRSVQQKMYDIFEKEGLNPDTVVKAPNAVTRLPQTPNRKTKTLVKTFYINSYPLELEDFTFFYGVLPLPDRKVPKPKQRTQNKGNKVNKQEVKSTQIPVEKTNLVRLQNWNEFTLNRQREEDIYIFVKEAVKQGIDIIGNRTWLATVLCFHALVSSNGDNDYAYNRFIDYWNLLVELKVDYDNSFEEMEKRIQKAWDYYNDWVNDTWDRVKYKTGGLFYKNITMLEKLGIVDNYYIQWKMKTIKIRNKKYEAARKRFERLEKGETKGSMAEYNQERKANKEHLLDMLKRHLERNPKAKRKDLAELLGVHPTYITKLKKEL